MKKVRLTLEQWETVLENLKEFNEEVEVVWLEGCLPNGDGEWVICDDCELIEDGFKSEEEAWQRYEEILTLLENK